MDKFKTLSYILALSVFNTNTAYSFDAIVNNVVEKIAKNDKRYLSFNLVSGSDIVEAKKWDVFNEDEIIFQQGQLLHLTGYFSKYKDKLQFIVKSATVVNDEIRYQATIPTAPNYQKLISDLKTFFTKITDVDYKKIIDHVFGETTLKKFCATRAGLKNHHTVYGGLLWHTVTMLKLAKSVIDTYDYLSINASLLYAGIIFHDIGKIVEIGDYHQNKYSLKGELLGHIFISAQLIDKVGQKLDIDPKKVALLQHLILASHGKLENGSPVEPKSIESIILSHLDNLDAKLGMIFIALGKDSLVSQSETQETRLDGKLINFYFHHLTKKES